MLDLVTRAAAAPPEEARRILEDVLRAAGDRIWVARNAARLYTTHVGDCDAARYVIDTMQPLTCIEWRLVSAAFSELGDRAAAGKCLERAATNARTATDLCIVALGYRDAGYEDEAWLLVDGAVQLATHAMDAWTVACCLRDAIDPTDPRVAPLVERVVTDADYSRDALWRHLAERILPRFAERV